MSASVCLAFLDQGGSDDDGAEPLKIKTIPIRSAFKRWLLCGGVKQMHLGHKLISYQTLCCRLLPQNKSRNLRLELFVLFPDLQHLGDPVARKTIGRNALQFHLALTIMMTMTQTNKILTI